MASSCSVWLHFTSPVHSLLLTPSHLSPTTPSHHVCPLPLPSSHHHPLIPARFLLRRSAARAFSAAPSKAFIATPRSITTIAPAARARQQQWTISAFQRRFASDDATKTPENFAQTAAEAPLEDGLTPAPKDATDASATVGADALESVAQAPTENTRSRTRSPPNNPPNKVVYVGNLFYEVTTEQLTQIFSRFGEVDTARIIYDPRGMSRG
jgi:hypothetical protein